MQPNTISLILTTSSGGQKPKIADVHRQENCLAVSEVRFFQNLHKVRLIIERHSRDAVIEVGLNLIVDRLLLKQ